MFRRRLVAYLVGVALLSGVLVVRLLWLQRVAGAYYDERVEDSYILPSRWLDTLRGSLYDRKGRLLAVDQASHDLCAQFHWCRLFDERRRSGLVAEYLGERDHRNKTVEDAERYWAEQRATARRILTELAVLCDIPEEQLLTAVGRINDQIYNLQTVRSRIMLCREHDLVYESQPNIRAIRADLRRLMQQVPELAEADPNTVILGSDVAEMHQYLPVLENISGVAARQVEESFPAGGDTEPVTIRSSKSRYYPYGDTACHVLGQVGPVPEHLLSSRPDGRPSEEQLQDYYLGDRRGARGMEAALENYLRGRRGWEQFNRKGEPASEPWERLLGADARLTLDIELQKAIQAVFEQAGDTGAAVVIDVPTGEVLALVSVPTFDLNQYYEPDTFRLVNEIGQKDPEQRGYNRALSVNYTPGSTIKPAILTGALEKGVITDRETIDCDRYYKDWVGSPLDIRNDGPMDAYSAIRKSCNFYFIKLVERMDGATVADWLQHCGWGRRILAWSDEEMAEAAVAGLRETPGHLAPWGTSQPGMRELRFISIGRGALDGSILHIANNTATVARNGEFLAPKLLLEPTVRAEPQRLVSATIARIVQRGMRDAIYESDGTAYSAELRTLWPEDRVRLCGKTGTTQNSLFTCFAQSDQGQKLAIAVVVDKKEGVQSSGGHVAAPLGREILIACAQVGYLPPVGSEGKLEVGTQ